MVELIWPLAAAFALAYVTWLPQHGPAAPAPVPIEEPETPKVPDED